MASQRPPIIAHHLIWTLYGHWLANDPRGSGSSELREEKFDSLGPIHLGRKPPQLQPSRNELRTFHQQATPLLQFEKFWLDDPLRHMLCNAFCEVISEQGYTVWACAVLSNHAHMIVRRHRDDAITLWHRFADHARLRLREDASIANNHPIWSSRPYKKFLCTPRAVRSCISYVQHNPVKEGLAEQNFSFVKAYNNWPFHRPC